jgi:glycosyltransferase involved in cell wall biosynthesis
MTHPTTGENFGEIQQDHLPVVSVIMPFYNQYEFIEEAVSSILLQDYPNLEIIVVDDGSEGPSLDHISNMSPSIRILTQENAGPSAARNHGLEASTGKLVAFLDSDDVWPAGKLDHQLQPFLSEQGHDLVLSQLRKLVRAGQESSEYEVTGKPFYTIQLGCLITKREVFQTVGTFDESLRFSEDQDWFLRARELGVPMVKVACEGLYYRSHPESLTKGEDRASDYGLLSVLRRSLKRRKPAGGASPRSLLSISAIPEWT